MNVRFHPFVWGLALSVLTLTGCADLQTVGRRTSLPDDAQGGVAIHLDAQQRLAFYAARKYCAEPSPDALSAYASALGLGVGATGQGAGSLAQALQSNAGSIGLRTQSITLMRDALYRMCEAANNGKLSNLEVAAFLRRSQDLTAVILAVEQLTGAVAANQVILTGTAQSDASADLVANQQLLDQARTTEQEKDAEVEEAQSARDAAAAERDAARTAEDEAKDALDEARDAEDDAEAAYESAQEADPDESEPATADAKEAFEAAKAEREAAEEALADAEADTEDAEGELQAAERTLELKKEQRDDARKVREAIESAQNVALTNASAATSGAGRFSAVAPRKELSPEATREIAAATENMVRTVLDKSYLPDMCMSYLISIRIEGSEGLTAEEQEVARVCRDVLGSKAAREFQTSVQGFGADDSTARLTDRLERGDLNRDEIRRWLDARGEDMSVTFFLFGDGNAALRRQFLNTH